MVITKEIIIVFVVFSVVILSGCSGKHVAMDVDKATYYKAEFEEIYQEYAELAEKVFKKATQADKLKRAELKARFQALLETAMQDTRLEKDSLSELLKLTGRLGL